MMPFTQSELDTFYHFASCRLEEGFVESLSDCVNQWEIEKAETIAAIKEGLEDVAAGRTQPFEEAIAEIRAELGLPQRDPVS
jgi:hypothetical protein